MGAQQSTPGSSSNENATGATKTCYYELIGVERDATDVEIKKAYRKKALELHPDRNLHDIPEATRKFAEIQAAYEVLSDPQERAWYDSHREAILAGSDDIGNGVEPTSFRNVRLTTTEEIYTLIRKFNATVPFNDEPTGFFGIARETFEHLALEEEVAADMGQLDCPEYSTFGSSDDDYEAIVKPFYALWTGFATKKSFSWKEKYRLSDAPDRRVRRLMEKENKKCREDAAHEFNDAIRFLVTFVRKRDPRCLSNLQTDAQRQKELRDAAAAQAARSRAANQRNIEAYELPQWSQSRNDDAHEVFFSDTEQDSEVEIMECVVCNKSFKSIQQLEAHERSKKHIKAVYQLRQHMKKEGLDLELDGTSVHHNEQDEPICSEQMNVSVGFDGVGDEASKAASIGPTAQSCTDEPKHRLDDTISSLSSSDQDDNDYAPRDEVEERLGLGHSEKNKKDDSTSETEEISLSTKDLDLQSDFNLPQEKKGMAKAKRQKKADRQLEEADAKMQCVVCEASFASRSKLFDHLHRENHASPVPNSNTSSKRKKEKKKK